MTQHRNVSPHWLRRAGVVLASGALALSAAGAPASADQGARAHRFTHVDLGKAAKGLTFTPAAASNKRINVMLQLQGRPVALHLAAAHRAGKQLSRAEQRAISNDLKAPQDQLAPRITHAGGTVVAKLQWAYNGVQVQVREKDVARLATLPGVVAVHQVHSFRPLNTNGVPFVGGPEAWGDFGKTGKGVKVGIIDTGIDYTHKDFGGVGTAAAWNYAKQHSTVDPATDPALSAQFGEQAPKVKGGTDLVGDDYNAGAGTLPHPDANPLDCYGHGSHVAGTSAGFGVLDDGSTFHGPYDKDTVSSHDWKVGPGVAPEADLYAYRVFGCAGDSNVVDAGIDAAVANKVDVISMSLGSDFGGTDDPTTVAAENAAAAGITVVAASGNSGHNAYMTSSPASGNHVLSVAALDGSRQNYPGARLTFDNGSTVDTIDANGAPLPSGSLPVKVLRDSSGGISLGCDPKEYAGTTGALVVTRRGTCARVARAIYGQQAGAKAVVMVNSDGSLPPYEGPITSNPDTGEAYDVTIPFLGAAGTGANVTALNAGDGGQVTLADHDVPNTAYSKSASFTSAGPRNPDSAPKPEVIAPGVSVASVGMGTGDGFAIESGTSMATPMTSGAAALVKQAHRDWSGAEVKAALQNTADPTRNGDYDVRLAGTGAVQVQKAIDSTVLAQTADGLNSLAFGFVPGTGDYHATRTFTLTNTGDQVATYDLSVVPNGEQPDGPEVKVQPARVQLQPGTAVDVPVELSMSAQAFKALKSDDTSSVGVGDVQDFGGDVVATPEGATPGQQTLRVAYLMVPRGLSDVRAGKPSPFRAASGSTFSSTLPVSNPGVHGGTADLYAWGATDAADTGSRGMDIRDVGVQSFPDGNGDATLVFAINNWGPSTNQSVNEFDVAIDNDQDGLTDYYVVGYDIGKLLTGSFDGRFGSFVIDAKTGDLVDANFADAPMNGSVVELPAPASEVGVTGARPRFDYKAAGFSVLDSTLADETGSASFDAFHPALSTGDFADVPSGGQATLPLSMDRAAQRVAKSLGWLVVSVDDANGAAQADEVPAPGNLGR